MTGALKPLMTRKEIADEWGFTVRQVEDNERRWGLDAARSKVHTRPLLYRRAIVVRIFAALLN